MRTLFIFQAEQTESGTLLLPRRIKQPGYKGGLHLHPVPRSRSGAMPSVLLYLHDEHTGNFTLLYFTLLYFTLLYFTVISFTFRQSTVPDCLETCSGLLSHGQNKTRRESAAHSPCTTRFSTCDSKVCHWTRSRATFHIYLFIIPR